MLIVPSIDLLDGKCVRLYKGDYDKSKIYQERPEKAAAGFEEAGARWIHVVDLDAAARAKELTRSAFVRTTVNEKIKEMKKKGEI